MTTDPTTAISRRRRPRGRYLKTQDGAVPKREKLIPEYLEADEVWSTTTILAALRQLLWPLGVWCNYRL